MKTFVATMLSVAAVLLVTCEQPVTGTEEGLFISPVQYVPFGMTVPSDVQSAVKVTKTVWPDLTVTLDYEYEPKETSDISYLRQEIETSRSEVESTVQTGLTGVVTKFVFEQEGLTLRETHEYGYNKGTSTFQIVRKDGTRVGNILRVSWGKVAYTATIVGPYIDGEDVWKAIFDDKLNAIAAYKW